MIPIEYKVVYPVQLKLESSSPAKRIQEVLNDLGQEGWQLVQAPRDHNGVMEPLIFSRPVEPTHA